MRCLLKWCGLVVLVVGTGAGAEFAPVNLSLVPDDSSVYAPPAPPREDEGLNMGGVNVGIDFRYMTNNVYRGVDRANLSGNDTGNGPNLQFDAKVEFNLGKFPHPFIGTFVNIADSDPLTNFQEVRPNFGFTWNLRPFDVEVGNINYIFPERDELNTGEVYGKISFDDTWLFRTDRRMFTPYVLGAWDYNKYHGVYLEAGVRHDFVIEGTGITLSAVASIAYVINNEQFSTKVGGKDTGLQHYELGVIGTYSLNKLFNFSSRYGTFTLEGYVYYDDRTSSDLKADIQIWGGGGIGFRY